MISVPVGQLEEAIKKLIIGKAKSVIVTWDEKNKCWTLQGIYK